MAKPEELVPVMEPVDVGLPALLDPADNFSAQLESVIRYGLPSALLTSASATALVLGITGDPAFSALFGGIPGLLVGFAATVWNIRAPRNAVPRIAGNLVKNWIGPTGWQCYWPRPIADLWFQASVAERQTNPFRVHDVETKNKVRYTVTFKVRRFFVRWPLPYVRMLESTLDADAPVDAMVELLAATIRKFINLYEEDDILSVSEINMMLANVLSGEVDEVPVDLNQPMSDDNKFVFSNDEDGKTVRQRLRELGIWIPNGGVDVVEINEPQEVADARAEVSEMEARVDAIEVLAERRSKLQEKYKDMDVDRILEDGFVASGHARMNVIRSRGSGGKDDPGDLVQHAAVTTNVPPDGKT